MLFQSPGPFYRNSDSMEWSLSFFISNQLPCVTDGLVLRRHLEGQGHRAPLHSRFYDRFMSRGQLWFVPYIVWREVRHLHSCGTYSMATLLFKKDFIYLLLERGGGREKEKERNIGCLSCDPYWGPGLQPRQVP